MFFRFFYFLLFFGICANSSIKEGIDFFTEGDYAQARTVLGKESFDENWKAQLYLLASQEFEPKERSEALLAGLKNHLRTALAHSGHVDYIPAKLVEAFWNLYSEQTVRLPGDVFRGLGDLNLSRVSLRPTERHASAQGVAQEGDRLLASSDTERDYHAINMGPAEHGPFPPLAAGLEEVNTEDIVRYIRHAQYFPISTLFEGRPSEQEGFRILCDLVRERNPHALYFLGAFFLSNEEGEGTALAKNKGMGLGCMMAAAHLGNASAFMLSKKILNMDDLDGWANNCKIWCFSREGKESPCLGCGGDSTGKWWHCGLGLCGFKTRWNAAQLFSSIRNVSRTTLENLAMLAGMGLIFVQQLEDLGAINPIFGENKPVSGIIGLLMSGGAFGAARIGN
jgi:hypothetical protein